MPVAPEPINQSIRNLIEEREGALQEGRIWWDLSRFPKPILSQARENMRPRCNFFFACFFWLKKKMIKKRPKNQLNKQTVICDPSIFLGFALKFNFDTEFYWDFIFRLKTLPPKWLYHNRYKIHS